LQDSGLISRTGIKHDLKTVHGQVIKKCEEKFHNEGYTTITEQNEKHGLSSTPDLIAKKGDEIILIEVIDRSWINSNDTHKLGKKL
jgi:hypothetical protein